MMQNEPEEALNREMEPEVADAEDVETLKQALVEEKEKAEGYLANWQRAQADFINYKRRAEQERVEFSKFSNATLILSLLPFLDDLERAFASVPPRLAKHDWVDGIRLIDRKFRGNLEAQGLSQIEALGKPFAPEFHEAVRQDKGKEGTIIEEIQTGYMFKDRLLRPAKVVVGDGNEDENKEE
ncbi:nucleotide exchange factor GrpE [Chloroflexota bacterium]